MKRVWMIVFVLNVFVTNALFSEITAVSNVQLIPPNPGLGQTVEIRWQFTEDNDWNDPRMLVAVSTQCALRNAQIPGQWLVIGDNCVNPAQPEYATVEGTGCDMGNNFSAGIHSSTEAGTYTFRIPDSLIPGQTYYAIVGMRNYNIYLRNSDVQVTRQNCVAFTVPLPAPYIQLSKMAEGTTADPDGLVLFTINYEAGNITGGVITDVVDSRFTILEVYNGGSRTGQTVTWNLGNISSPQKGFVSFLARLNAGVASGTVINNTATGSASGGVTAVSNNATVTVSQPGMSINKSVSTAYADLGSTITYTINYINTGTRLVEYQNFDSGPVPPAGWTFNPAGGTWTNVNGYLEQTQVIAGYPGLMNDTMTPVRDAIYQIDMRISSANIGHFDATFRFNSCDGSSYQARLHSNGCGGLTDPGSLILEVPSGMGTVTLATVVNPRGMVILCDEWYSVKIKVSGTSIMLKVWPKGTPEYGGWDIDITDNSVSCLGVVGFQANEGPAAWDNLKVFSLAGTTNSPRLFDTVPVGVDYLSCAGGTSCSRTGSIVNWNVGSTGADAQIASWRGVVNGACGSVITNAAGIDSNDPPPPVLSNLVYTTIMCDATPAPTPTRTPTASRTRTVTPTFTRTATPVPPTATFTRTRTGTPTFTGTNTPVPLTATFTRTPTGTASATPTFTYTATPTLTLTLTLTGTATFTYTLSSTYTLTNTPSSTASPTFTFTITPSDDTYTVTPTVTQTFTETNTFTNTATPTGTPTATGTYTATASPTHSFTNTPSLTASPTFTFTITPSDDTFTVTPTATQTHTWTPTLTFTGTYTVTYTETLTPTDTGTGTLTPSFSPTFTLTASATVTITASATSSTTPSATATPDSMPVELKVNLSAYGDDPAPGARITYRITIQNDSPNPVYNLRIWDTLPQNVQFSHALIPQAPSQDGQFIEWDMDGTVLDAYSVYIMEFVVIITHVQEGDMIQNIAAVDYNDGYYQPGVARHPPVYSEASFYPEGLPVVFPNPFSMKTAKDGSLKVLNLVPGSRVEVYTLSGEMVFASEAKSVRVQWDGRNRRGYYVSPGVYYYLITNRRTERVYRGKLFVME